MVRSIVSLWHGAYLVDHDEVVEERPVPTDPATLAQRMGVRAQGLHTPEEASLLGLHAGGPWTTRDRRLVSAQVALDPDAPGDLEGRAPTDRAAHREALLLEAERALRASWDPSVHLQEAVRALRDVDRALNLLGERLAGWASHDTPGVDADDPLSAARALLDRVEPTAFGPEEPLVREARRRLAQLVLDLRAAREAVERAVSAAAPERTPNLSELLGPDLASRLVAQAGGLERLARLPASTVQVLGAEKAFFEHLRGRAPPPRHGLLFLHPAIQTSPRTERGRLARTLAAKAAIAARLDRAGRPVDPTLKVSFERRRDALRKQRGARKGSRRPSRGSPSPLDRATADR